MISRRADAAEGEGNPAAKEREAMVELRVKQLAEGKGIDNPFSLSRESGVAYANCYKIWNSQQKMIGLDTLDRLCEALNCEPGDILIRAPAGARRAKTRR